VNHGNLSITIRKLGIERVQACTR